MIINKFVLEGISKSMPINKTVFTMDDFPEIEQKLQIFKNVTHSTYNPNISQKMEEEIYIDLLRHHFNDIYKSSMYGVGKRISVEDGLISQMHSIHEIVGENPDFEYSYGYRYLEERFLKPWKFHGWYNEYGRFTDKHEKYGLEEPSKEYEVTSYGILSELAIDIKKVKEKKWITTH